LNVLWYFSTLENLMEKQGHNMAYMVMSQCPWIAWIWNSFGGKQEMPINWVSWKYKIRIIGLFRSYLSSHGSRDISFVYLQRSWCSYPAREDQHQWETYQSSPWLKCRLHSPSLCSLQDCHSSPLYRHSRYITSVHYYSRIYV